jgi:hypothetical protein
MGLGRALAAGGAGVLLFVARAEAAAPVVATAPTFELLADGSSRFAVPLSASVAVDETKGADTVVYTMRGVRVPKRNDRNPLVTTFWNTPVRDARLEPHGKGTRFVIRLRAAAAPTSRLVAGEGGRFVLEVLFPKGDWLPATAADAPAPTP